jgi:RNA recognition motif-containing protein
MKIFIGNLSSEATEEKLRRRFEKYGDVDSITILDGLLSTEDENGMGFVEMPDEKRARKAIKRMNRKKVFGIKLNVHEARAAKQDRRPQTRGGGRRRDDLPEINKDIKNQEKDKSSQNYKTADDLFDGLDN